MSDPDSKVVVSLGQFNVALGRPHRNLKKVQQMTAEAARRGSDIVVFPELWPSGYDLANAADYATVLDQGIFTETAALAREFGLYILGSCLSTITNQRFGNTAVLFDPDGQILASYTKVHLFRLMDEDRFLAAGDRLATAATPWGKLGLAICYDLRFPELFRAYALAECSLVFLPAEWPQPRLAHWRTLLQARAIENQLFVVACNRVGRDRTGHFFGRSAIVDPWGEMVIEGGDGEALLTATLDLSKVAQAREKIPIFADRRPEVYSRLLE